MRQIEIGCRRWGTGAIVSVKVLGVLGLIDSGETDWKLLVISNEDPLAKELNDIDDVDVVLPGLISSVTHWLRMYKTPGNGEENKFAFEGRCQNREFAENILEVNTIF